MQIKISAEENLNKGPNKRAWHMLLTRKGVIYF